jgi:squalene cyclase
MIRSFPAACGFAVAGLAAMVLFAALPDRCRAQEQGPEKKGAEAITPAADGAIQRGLGFLVSRQQQDGSFGSGNYQGNTAITALGGLALMSGGSTPGRGPHGPQVNRCVDYLLANAMESGLIVYPRGASHGPMYDHGFATMFLAECYGMSPRPELREKLSKAVKLIVNTQNKEGGWRYQPQRNDADISVTICEVMALRAARNAGLQVPKQTIDRCIDYVKRSQNPDGGFMYMLPAGESDFARTGAGVVALYSAGIYEGPEIKKGLDYLVQWTPKAGVVRREKYFFYGHYYAVQAMWQAGGDYWKQWYPAIRDELIARQRKDGSWTSPISIECDTAMACIVLQIPNNYLPIFQR